MSKTTTNCKNCESTFESNFKFCPNCGMNAKEELTVGVLFYNTISNYFLYDSRFFKSFFPLLLKPGYLAEKFIQGKRLSYLHPAQLYLFISFIFFFLLSISGKSEIKDINDEFKRGSSTLTTQDSLRQVRKDSINIVKLRKSLEDNRIITGMTDIAIDSIVDVSGGQPVAQFSMGLNEKKMDSLIAIDAPKLTIYKEMGLDTNTPSWFKRLVFEQWLKFYKERDAEAVFKTFYNAVPIALFFLLPIFALLLKLLFFKRGRYAHHLVFSFYFFSYLFAVFTVLIIADLILDIPAWILTLITLSTFIYLVVAVRKFYGQGWFLSWFKSSMATFFFLSFVAPITFAITGVISFFLY